MNQCTPAKRKFKLGDIVRLQNSSQPMRVLKYDDKLRQETGKNILSVTWKERNYYKVIKCDENDLLHYVKSAQEG